jgi:methylmalonyl-CoA/ethylmalonyl-CoA epimerase
MVSFQLDHVAVAVRSIDPALKLFRDALGGNYLFDGPIESGGDRGSWRWYQLGLPGGGKIELLEPLGDGFLTRFLEERGEGFHHITLKTDDIEAAMDRIRQNGFELVDVNLDDENWKEAFLRPKQAHGTLIQIAQSKW